MYEKVMMPDGGSVQLIEWMGSDRAVAEAAWASTASCMNRTQEEVERVIRFLARSKPPHWSPFATGGSVKLRLRMADYLWRQWRRHRIGFARVEHDDRQDMLDDGLPLLDCVEPETNPNSESRRYGDGPLEFMHTKPDTWRLRSPGKKSGSSDKPLSALDAAMQEGDRRRFLAHAEVYYTRSLERGVSPEQARMDLPQSSLSSHVETGSLYAYARICEHRIHPEAEGPIRPYAMAVSEVLGQIFPIAWDALTNRKG